MHTLSTISSRKSTQPFVHALAWFVYASVIYSANYLANPAIKLGDTVLFLVPYILTFYVSLHLLQVFSRLGTIWTIGGVALFMVASTTAGHAYLFVILPKFGVYVFNPAHPEQFAKDALLGFLLYFSYALLYFFADRNIRRRIAVTDLRHQGLKRELENAKLRELALRTKQENMLQEQAFLRAEINPNFLHNTLNILHAQAQRYSEELATNIGKLSKMMRYSIQTTEEQPGRVTVTRELENLQLLLDIHGLHCKDPKLVLMYIDGKPDGLMVPPLSMITMVENAMKYGDLTDPENPVLISLIMRTNELHFRCRNKVMRRTEIASSTQRGLANLKRRLDISFKDRYTLCNRKDGHFYNVEMIIYN